MSGIGLHMLGSRISGNPANEFRRTIDDIESLEAASGSGAYNTVVNSYQQADLVGPRLGIRSFQIPSLSAAWF